jgi:serine/threonine protein kinase/tetratricopeptide (TPR) repeat protein
MRRDVQATPRPIQIGLLDEDSRTAAMFRVIYDGFLQHAARMGADGGTTGTAASALDDIHTRIAAERLSSRLPFTVSWTIDMNDQFIFLAALDIEDPTERADFLDKVCQADTTARLRIEELLRQHESGKSSLLPDSTCRADGNLSAASPESATEDFQPIGEQPGSVIGPYRLLEQIGRGGMGIVFVAEQQWPVRRKVALKLIKPGMDTREVVARFEHERQALALMDHPNIARVLDAGSTGSGRPYFVMELVRGVPITGYCDQNQLGLPERLELFACVSNAVQHAHQKGIIHRDLKPSNVLVALQDGRPVVKIIDFGIAKAMNQQLIEKTIHTRFAQMIGTPLYMSPEQAGMSGLDVDTRTDIYSLGVILYELLTGGTPFDKQRITEATYDEIRRIIREEEPPKPSARLAQSTDSLPTVATLRRADPAKLVKFVRRDLDWIVMKCLEKDRTRRYETANGLAREIDRYLNDQPVEAGPPSATYRLAKFIRRNRGPVLGASVVLLLLIAGVTGTTIGFLRAQEALMLAGIREQEAIAAARSESLAKQIALGQKAKAEGAARAERAAKLQSQKRLEQAEKAHDFLTSLFRNLSPFDEEKGDKALRVILGERLDEAAARLSEDTIGDALITARLQNELAATQIGLGNPEKAIPLLEQAIQTRESLLGDDHHDTLTSVSNLALAHLDAKQYEEAEHLFQRAIEKQTEARHPNAMVSMSGLANVKMSMGKLEEAIALFEQTLQMQTEELGPDDRDTLITAHDLAMAYVRSGQYERAISLLEDTVQRQTSKLGADHFDTIIAEGHLAQAYQLDRKLEQAIQLAKEVAPKLTAKVGQDHRITLQVLATLGGAYADSEKFTDAIALLEPLIARLEKELGEADGETLLAMATLAESYRAMGKYNLAMPLLERRLERLRAARGDDDPKTLVAMNDLSVTYQHTGRLDRAIPLLEQALEKMRLSEPVDWSEILATTNNLAMAYMADKRFPKAIELFESALQRLESELASDPNRLTLMNNLAMAYKNGGKLDKAIPLYHRTLDELKTTFGEDHRYTLITTKNLARAYWAAEQYDQAISLFQAVIPKLREKFGDEHREVLTGLSDLADVYRDQGMFEQAIPTLEETLVIRERTLGRDHADTLADVASLAKCKFEAGRFGEAVPLLEELRQKFTQDQATRRIEDDLLVAYVKTSQRSKALALIHQTVSRARTRHLSGDRKLASELAKAAHFLLELKAYSDAEPLLRECLAIREQTQPEVWTTFNTRSMLGAALIEAGQSQLVTDAAGAETQLKNAELLLLDGYQGLRSREADIPLRGRHRLVEALARLVRLYEIWNRPDDLAKWQSKLQVATD